MIGFLFKEELLHMFGNGRQLKMLYRSLEITVSNDFFERFRILRFTTRSTSVRTYGNTFLPQCWEPLSFCYLGLCWPTKSCPHLGSQCPSPTILDVCTQQRLYRQVCIKTTAFFLFLNYFITMETLEAKIAYLSQIIISWILKSGKIYNIYFHNFCHSVFLT